MSQCKRRLTPIYAGYKTTEDTAAIGCATGTVVAAEVVLYWFLRIAASLLQHKSGAGRATHQRGSGVRELFVTILTPPELSIMRQLNTNRLVY